MHRNWFLGIFFVLGAGILITSRLGILSYHIGFWALLVAMFLVAAFVESLIQVSVTGMIFSLAFLAIIFAKPLGIVALAPWTILGAALLLSIGLSLIIKPRWRWRRNMTIINGYHHGHGWGKSFRHGYDDIKNVNESETIVDVNMSSSIRYLQSNDFKQAVVKVSMGSAKVYFDNVILNEAGATIVVDGSFGGVELYVPRTWNVKLNVNTSFGIVEEKGAQEINENGPVVAIQGDISFGNLSVIYI
ncbi:LiaF transmembrane domain-containing protein [Levilactobacillus fujinensis]|uniref:LiaF domain-containing protein n=1 Tax=Levilactobacillus fujinensis TaxID=2486024 RepID=A0ABW1TDG3_9LACO|nr:LiaF domain-containing protein [Levilactobacillus fujinensis]